GMRLGEICQLTLDDFVVIEGVDVIWIHGDNEDETKRVKTVASNRRVPVHSELRKVGLMAHVEKRRAEASATARLFPDVPKGPTNFPSDPFSKFYERFLKKVGIVDRRKVFHSFRHTYRDALREADISIEKVSALGGWSSSQTQAN